MKSTGRNVGSVNLRGKRSHVLGCRCCVALDLRDKVRAKEAAQEMWGAETDPDKWDMDRLR